MCTVTFVVEPDGFELFFNRDEYDAREPELPPVARAYAGVATLLPRDGRAGGTWIAVTEHGLAFAILNARPAATAQPPRAAEAWSRGLVVPAVAAARDRDEVAGALRAVALRRVQPFHLLLLGAPRELPARACWWTWDGVALDGPDDVTERLPLVSTSFVDPDVALDREALLARLADENHGVTPDVLLRFHCSHEPRRGPRSVCMHRGDARTRSLTRVTVRRELVRLEHHAGSPCLPGVVRRLETPRRPPGGSRGSATS